MTRPFLPFSTRFGVIDFVLIKMNGASIPFKIIKGKKLEIIPCNPVLLISVVNKMIWAFLFGNQR